MNKNLELKDYRNNLINSLTIEDVNTIFEGYLNQLQTKKLFLGYDTIATNQSNNKEALKIFTARLIKIVKKEQELQKTHQEIEELINILNIRVDSGKVFQGR